MFGEVLRLCSIDVAPTKGTYRRLYPAERSADVPFEEVSIDPWSALAKLVDVCSSRIQDKILALFVILGHVPFFLACNEFVPSTVYQLRSLIMIARYAVAYAIMKVAVGVAIKNAKTSSILDKTKDRAT